MDVSMAKFTDWFEFVKSNAAIRYHGMDFVVLGGGPSLNSFDFSFCEDKVTIGVNAIGRIYHPLFCYLHDPWAVNESQGYINISRSNLILSNIILEWRKWQRIFHPDRNPEIWTTPWGEDLDVGACIDPLIQEYSSSGGHSDHKELYSICSGHYARTRDEAEKFGHLYHNMVSAGIEAIDFAIELGAKHVYLIGFDGYSADPSRDHFYTHETFVKTSKVKPTGNWQYKNFNYFALETVAKRAMLRARGGELYLLNADSYFTKVLPVFPSKNIRRSQQLKNRIYLKAFLPFYAAKYNRRIRESIAYTVNLMNGIFSVAGDKCLPNANAFLVLNPLVRPRDPLSSLGYRLAQLLYGVYCKVRRTLSHSMKFLYKRA